MYSLLIIKHNSRFSTISKKGKSSGYA